MKTISIMNYKGGVGKTTTAVNTAYILATLHERKTLLIDCDPQGNASYFYGKYDETKKSMTGVLAGEYTLKSAIRRTKYRNLDIVQADKNLEFVHIPNFFVLEEQIQELDYEYVLIDCHPTFEPYTEVALLATDLCIVPTKIDRNSINGLSFFEEHFQSLVEMNMDLEYKVLITMFRYTRGNKIGLNELIEKNEYPIFESLIRLSAAVDESTFKRKPLLRCASRCHASTDYLEFVQELIEEVER